MDTNTTKSGKWFGYFQTQYLSFSIPTCIAVSLYWDRHQTEINTVNKTVSNSNPRKTNIVFSALWKKSAVIFGTKSTHFEKKIISKDVDIAVGKKFNSISWRSFIIQKIPIS